MKKAQALLPFFAQQLISILIFLIVVIALMSLTKEVSITTQEFEEKTSFYLGLRKMLSSADCLAYEEYGTLFKDSSLVTGSTVYAGIIDITKMRDYKHVNCNRLDDFSKVSDFQNKGAWSAKEGTGIAVKYAMILYYKNEEGYWKNVFNYCEENGTFDCTSGEFSGSEYTSVIPLVNKRYLTCNDNPLKCQDTYGAKYECNSRCRTYYEDSKYEDSKWCIETSTSPLPEHCKTELPSLGKCASFETYGCVNTFPKNDEPLSKALYDVIGKGNSEKYALYSVEDVYFPEGNNAGLIGHLHYFQLKCSPGEKSFEQTLPVLVKLPDGSLTSGLFYYKECIVKGENYKLATINSYKETAKDASSLEGCEGV